MQKQWYTIQEVAELLEFSDQTIRDWVRTGRIRAARPGLRAWRIPRAEVERLMSQSGIEPSSVAQLTHTPDSPLIDLMLPEDTRHAAPALEAANV